MKLKREGKKERIVHLKSRVWSTHFSFCRSIDSHFPRGFCHFFFFFLGISVQQARFDQLCLINIRLWKSGLGRGGL